jgi:choice-of-anchor A domain-containing protein
MKFLSTAFILSLLAFTNSSYSESEKAFKLFDFNVYVAQNFTYFNSDVQGRVGAGRNVIVQKFAINKSINDGDLAISVGENLHCTELTIYGNIEAKSQISLFESSINGSATSDGNIRMINSTISGDANYGDRLSRTNSSVGGESVGNKRRHGKKAELVVNHQEVIEELKKLSYDLSHLESNSKVSYKKNLIQMKATVPESVFNLNCSAIETAKNIDIIGDKYSTEKITINVRGHECELHDLKISLNGIGTSQVLWNFYEANSIYISHTSNGKFGFAGIIIASNADIEFTSGLVTGAIYAKSLRGGNANVPGGQVNLQYVPRGRVKKL